MPGRALFLATLWLVALAAGAAAQSPPPCPAPGAASPLEVIPCTAIGNTLAGGEDDTVNGDAYAACDLPSGYTGKDVVYTLRLHPGNQVGLRLAPHPSADPRVPDLVLAVLKVEGGSRRCEASSEDIQGSSPEEITARAYGAGDYLLVVDSARWDLGGAFTLEVSGTNLLPDMAVTASIVPPLGAAPQTVVAGRDFGYRVEVTNRGQLAASAVRLVVGLPAGVTPKPPLPAGCSPAGREVRCDLENLAVGSPPLGRTFTLRLDAAARGDASGQLSIEAQVSSREADSAPGDNSVRASASVAAMADLEVQLRPVPEPLSGDPPPASQATAGLSITYTSRVSNAGPSTATAVRLKLFLPAGLRLTAAPGGCEPPPQGQEAAVVNCSLGMLAPGQKALRRITLAIAGDKRVDLAARAEAQAAEPDSGGGANNANASTHVRAVVDLAITKHSSPNPVVAGRDLTYSFLVTNDDGPSDATQVEITDELPQGLSFVGSSELSSQSCTCQEQLNDGPPCETDTERKATVTCRVPKVPSGGSESVAFTARARPSQLGDLANNAQVADTGATDRDSSDDGASETTGVEVSADLALVATASPDPVVAGANLAYALEVTNRGYSQSYGARVEICLPEKVRFLASPDDCCLVGPGCSVPGLEFPLCPGSRQKVACPVGALAPWEEAGFRLAAALDSDVEAQNSLSSTAKVVALESFEQDPDSGNNDQLVTTAVVLAADLDVSITDDPDPVGQSEFLTYTLTATNHGPSDAGAVELTADLSGSLSFPTAACSPPHETSLCTPNGQQVSCTVADFEAQAEATCTVTATSPAAPARGVVQSSASLAAATGGPPDPEPANDSAQADTTVADGDDADLAITLVDSVDPVMVGDPLTYELNLENGKPATAPGSLLTGVTATLCLPSAADLLPLAGPLSSYPTECPDVSENTACPFGSPVTIGRVVHCNLPNLDPGEQGTPLQFRFTVAGTASGAVRTLRASAAGAATAPVDADPNLANNEAVQETVVLQAAPLVLPFFEVDLNEGTSTTTLFSVRNATAGGLSLDYEIHPNGEPTLLVPSQSLPHHGTLAVNLASVTGLVAPPATNRATGWIGFDLSSGSVGPLPSEVDGEVVRFEASRSRASGAALVKASTAAEPRQLCQRWDIAFLDRRAANEGTDFVFFVPQRPGGTQPVVVGRAYDGEGDYLQEISITTAEESFVRNSRDLELLTKEGAIEWVFADGLLGNVSAVFKASSGLAVAVPGFCKLPAGAAAVATETLAVPYFRSQPEITTLFSLHNGGEKGVSVDCKYFSADGVEVVDETKVLGPHATVVVNVRAVLLAQLAAPPESGFVTITATHPLGNRQRVLSGYHLRIDRSDALGRASGEALVSPEQGHSPTKLCNKWGLRFLKGGSIDGKTEFLFYVPGSSVAAPWSASGKIYGEAGGTPTQVNLPPTGDTARSVSTAEPIFGVVNLPLGSGSVEWVFAGNVVGNISAILQAGDGLSVMVPGTCLDQETP